MSLRSQAISGMTWTVVQQFGVAGLGFIVQIFLARLIAPDQFGIYGLILIFNTIGNSLSDSGMGQSIIRSDKLDEEDYGTIFITNFIISILLYFSIVLFGPYIADFYDTPVIEDLLWVFCLSIIFTSFSTIQVYKLTKELNFKRQAKIQIPSVIISGIVGIALGYAGFGIWALVCMNVVQSFVLGFQYWLLTGWRPLFCFNLEKFKYHFKFGYKLTLSGLLSQIVSSMVTVIIGKFYTQAQLGYYTRASVMRNFIVNNISTALNKVSYPLFSSVKHDRPRLLLAYKKIQNLVIFVMAPIMLLAIIIAKPLFILLLGEQWLPSVFYFQLICITGILYPIHYYNLNVLKVYGKSGQYLTAEVLKKINLIIIISITAWFGMIALISGLIVHSFISLFINMFFGSKQLNYSLKEQAIDMVQTFLPALIVFGFIYGLILSFPLIKTWNSIIEIIFLSLTYCLCYLSLNIVLKTKAFTDIIDLLEGVPYISTFVKYLKPY